MRELNIKTIREAAIAANPEIMELKFGCVVRHTPVRELGIDYRGIYLHPARGKGQHLIYFEGERTGSQLLYSTTISEKHFESLGRPIRLADVLLAIEQAMKPDWKIILETLFRDRDGKLSWYIQVTFDEGGKGAEWDLLNDLTEQSDECLEFLASLLANK